MDNCPKKSTKKPKKQPKTILFVCTGNTCRSPMAERILGQQLKKQRLSSKFVAKSSGLSVCEYDMNDMAKKTLLGLGLETIGHVPCQLDVPAVLSAHMVVCMEKSHKDYIVRVVGDLPHIKTADEISRKGNIPDPYGGDSEVYQKTAGMLIELAKILCVQLKNKSQKPKKSNITKSTLEEK